MKRFLQIVAIAFILGLWSLPSAFSQCYELGTPIGQLTPVLKTSGGVCNAAAQAAAVCDCPAGFVAVGYEGDKGNTWGANVISRFRLRCKQLNSNGTLGATVIVTCNNGTAITATNVAVGPVDAAAGQVIVGGQLMIGCAIDAFRGYSKPLADVIAASPNTTSTAMPFLDNGTGGTLQAAQYAPTSNVIVGMQTYIDPGTNWSGGVAWRYALIVSCPVLVCSINGVTLSNLSACNNNGTPSNPADDFFTADATVTFANAPATGTLNLSGAATASAPVASLGAGTYTFTGVQMPANGVIISLTAAFSADPTCTLTNASAGTAPNACSVVPPPCAITGITVSNISACNTNGTLADPADDTFTANVTVTFTGGPAVGSLVLGGAGSATIPVASLGAGTYTFTGVSMSANGAPISLTAAFSANPTCTLSNNNAGTAPANCSPNAPTIPTMGQWGLILFGLIMFSLTVVFASQQQTAMATSGMGNMTGSTGFKLPFDKKLYLSVLPFVYVAFAMVFAFAILAFGYEMTNADVPGSLFAGLIVAYLVQFTMKSSPNK